ncbi:MAG TPA: hypothetical protein VFV99_10060 [Kofleriaceae bacterium]|nr:hypothetical protein [Kofleriaceae bacterium]
MSGALLATIGLAAATALVSGCGAGSTYRTTRIAPPGHTEWLFGAQVSGAGTVGIDEGGGDGGVAPLPELAVAARRGLDERFEVQVNTTFLPTPVASTGSIELAGKMRVAERGRWSLAVGSGVGYRLTAVGGAHIEDIYASVPVIGGIELGRHQLVLSIDGGYHRLYSSGANPVDIPFIGESIGFRWQVGRRWAVLPEIGGAWSPTANFMTEDSRLFHFGIAALWTR